MATITPTVDRMIAGEMLRRVENLDLIAARSLLYRRCVHFAHDEEGAGWSELREWRFADGSAVTEDGRGFLAHVSSYF